MERTKLKTAMTLNPTPATQVTSVRESLAYE
jgi:hypothetical protein